MNRMNIPIAKIKVDAATHPRMALDDETAEEYGRLIKDDQKLPPIIVFHDGKNYYLADGLHRLEGAKTFGQKNIEADVHQGSRRDAIQFAVGANHKHGLRRTNADKRKAVQIVLQDKEWREWSVNRIASLCNVSWDLVEKIRKIYLPETEDSDERLVERQGCKWRRKNVAPVGRRKSVALWPLFCWIAYSGKHFPLLHRSDRSNRSVHGHGTQDRDPPRGIGRWAFQKASLPPI